MINSADLLFIINLFLYSITLVIKIFDKLIKFFFKFFSFFNSGPQGFGQQVHIFTVLCSKNHFQLIIGILVHKITISFSIYIDQLFSYVFIKFTVIYHVIFVFYLIFAKLTRALKHWESIRTISARFYSYRRDPTSELGQRCT